MLQLSRAWRQAAKSPPPRWFHHALLCASAGALLACEPMIEAELSEPVECPEATQFPVRMSGLKTAQPYDYVAYRYDFLVTQMPSNEWTSESFTVRDETGIPCAGAREGTCAEQIAYHPVLQEQCTRHPGGASYGVVCSDQSVVTTRGEQVQRWKGTAQLRELLGDIDSIDDALLVAYDAGYSLVCNDMTLTSVERSAGGYSIRARRYVGDCPVVVYEDLIEIRTSGQLRVLSSREVERLNVCP